MQKIWSNKINEEVYLEKLESGLTVAIIPKKGTEKKYIIWGTEFGSIDNDFFIDGKEIIVPDGIAHYLEHKLFEQENGKNSLDVLSSLGVDANAYTTNNHTAYLFETTNNFYEALDEFMDYVQNPYFTDENIEKERGIIAQEIKMYDDYPDWKVYMNAMKAMYKNNTINIDVAGTVDSIAKINKENLYMIYNAFYRPENMFLVITGDFDVNCLLNEIKKRLKPVNKNYTLKRFYPDEPKKIVTNYVEDFKEISKPIFIIGYKDNNYNEQNKVKKDIAIEIICNMLIGKSSRLYQNLYEEGLISTDFSYNYEYAKTYSHILIQNSSLNPKKVSEEFDHEVKYYLEKGFDEKDFERVKKKIYGEYVKEYNDITDIADLFLNNYFKGINPFDFLEESLIIEKNYVEEVFKELFKKENKVLSIVFPMKK